MFGDEARDQRLVGNVAPGKDRAFRNRPVEAGRQIVDDDDRPAAVEEKMKWRTPPRTALSISDRLFTVLLR